MTTHRCKPSSASARSPIGSWAGSSVTGTSRNQRGAVLFIALILLVVLSLIGIASMQVTTLQERMAGNYYTQAKAFEYSEWMVRFQEDAIQTTVDGGGTYVANDRSCPSTYAGTGSVDAWAAAKTATTVGGSNAGNMITGSWFTREIDQCTGQSPLNLGGSFSGNTAVMFQVLGVDNDVPPSGLNTDATSMAVVATVYIP